MELWGNQGFYNRYEWSYYNTPPTYNWDMAHLRHEKKNNLLFAILLAV